MLSNIAEMVQDVQVHPTSPSPIAKAMAYQAAKMHGSTETFSDTPTTYFSYNGNNSARPYFVKDYSRRPSSQYTMSSSDNIYFSNASMQSVSMYSTSPSAMSKFEQMGDSCCGPKMPTKSTGHGGGCC